MTRHPFLADPTGVLDSTLALQAAIDFAMDNYMSVWLPIGVYKVTKGLQAIQRERMSVDGTPTFNGESPESPVSHTYAHPSSSLESMHLGHAQSLAHRQHASISPTCLAVVSSYAF